MGFAKFWILALCAVALNVVAVAPASAAPANCRNTGNFNKWLSAFIKEARASGVSDQAIRATKPYLTYSKRIIGIDRGQRIFALDFLSFSKRVIPKYRLARGGQLIKKLSRTFAKIEKKYGVPAPVIVALWGLESDFGANMGKDQTLPALATLAYDCRRPELFRPQLLAALKIVDRGDLTPKQMIGSWAGELGQTQFLPSHYLDRGVDFDGNGRVDLLHSKLDVLASTANYLSHIGWRRGEPWLEEVRVPSNLKWEEADVTIQHPRSQWASWGVKRANGKSLKSDALPASLIMPVGRKGPAFLAYNNYKIFLEWNNSLVYSTAASYYAARLAGAGPMRRPTGKITIFGLKEIKVLQGLLSRRGLDVGKIDGILGERTRIAVKTMQLKFGLPADSYPTPELVKRLRQR